MNVKIIGFHRINRVSFIMCISLLRTMGYEFLSLEDIFAGSGYRGVLLTFDDAYKEFYEKIYPILKKESIPAVLCVPVKHVGGYNVWDCKDYRNRVPLMSWEELRRVSEEVEIASHGLTHVRLSGLAREEAWSEIYDSKKVLEDAIGKEVRAFCYPYGDYDNNIVELVRKAGYKIGFTTKFGELEDSENMFEVRRIVMRNHVDPLTFFYNVSIRCWKYRHNER